MERENTRLEAGYLIRSLFKECSGVGSIDVRGWRVADGWREDIDKTSPKIINGTVGTNQVAFVLYLAVYYCLTFRCRRLLSVCLPCLLHVPCLRRTVSPRNVGYELETRSCYLICISPRIKSNHAADSRAQIDWGSEGGGRAPDDGSNEGLSGDNQMEIAQWIFNRQ